MVDAVFSAIGDVDVDEDEIADVVVDVVEDAGAGNIGVLFIFWGITKLKFVQNEYG